MNTKKQKILFWVFTTPIILMMLSSGIALLMKVPQNMEGMAHLGYPPYFVNILGIAKILGCAALLYRKWPTLTEWAYAGFTFEFLSASYSHYSSGDNAFHIIMPFIILALLAGSYHFGKKAKNC